MSYIKIIVIIVSLLMVGPLVAQAYSPIGPSWIVVSAPQDDGAYDVLRVLRGANGQMENFQLCHALPEPHCELILQTSEQKARFNEFAELFNQNLLKRAEHLDRHWALWRQVILGAGAAGMLGLGLWAAKPALIGWLNSRAKVLIIPKTPQAATVVSLRHFLAGFAALYVPSLTHFAYSRTRDHYQALELPYRSIHQIMDHSLQLVLWHVNQPVWKEMMAALQEAKKQMGYEL